MSARQPKHAAVWAGREQSAHEAHLNASGPERAWLSTLEARLARRAGRVRAAIEATGAVYVPERLHGVRIAAKKLRYAAELAADVPRHPITADIEGASRPCDDVAVGQLRRPRAMATAILTQVGLNRVALPSSRR